MTRNVQLVHSHVQLLQEYCRLSVALCGTDTMVERSVGFGCARHHWEFCPNTYEQTAKKTTGFYNSFVCLGEKWQSYLIKWYPWCFLRVCSHEPFMLFPEVSWLRPCAVGLICCKKCGCILDLLQIYTISQLCVCYNIIMVLSLSLLYCYNRISLKEMCLKYWNRIIFRSYIVPPSFKTDSFRSLRLSTQLFYFENRVSHPRDKRAKQNASSSEFLPRCFSSLSLIFFFFSNSTLRRHNPINT